VKARTTKTLTSTALEVLNTLATITAPCSVKTFGNLRENLRFLRWSQIATTSTFSSEISGMKFKPWLQKWPEIGLRPFVYSGDGIPASAGMTVLGGRE
jgi:hypothetical protein